VILNDARTYDIFDDNSESTSQTVEAAS